MTPTVRFQHLPQAAYAPTWALQETLLKGIIDRKIARRNAGLQTDEDSTDPALTLPESHLLFVEHSHVLTLGKSGLADHVVAPKLRLEELGVEYFPINRGGDITYHGPGQLVGYPILDLDQFFTDIGRYMRLLEEAVIRTCAEYGVTAGRIDGLTGVWVDPEAGLGARKIAALGVKCSRWVTMHGFAFNLNTDLDFFDLIVPCGIADRAVTSLAKETNKAVDMEVVSGRMRFHLGDLFNWKLIERA